MAITNEDKAQTPPIDYIIDSKRANHRHLPIFGGSNRIRGKEAMSILLFDRYLFTVTSVSRTGGNNNNNDNRYTYPGGGGHAQIWMQAEVVIIDGGPSNMD